MIADHFDGVYSCGKLSEGEEIDIRSVSKTLVDDGFGAGRVVGEKGCEWVKKTNFDLISLSPRTRLERI